MDEIRFLIGVDGGGTNCRAAIATLDGAIIGRGDSGPSNIASNIEGATINILDAINKAIAAAGLTNAAYAKSAAYLGLAGANVGTYASELSARLPFGGHQVGGDAPIALQGALSEGDGAIAILGTGSAFLSRKGEALRLIGGWGFQLSDIGGGARLGRAALELALLAHDGMAQSSALTVALHDHFENNPDNLVLFAKTATPPDYGKFAPLVIEYLAQNDANAQRLMQDAAQSVDAAFDALDGPDMQQIALLGGLAHHYPPFLATRHQRRLVTSRADALTGALELAAKLAKGQAPLRGGRS